MARKKRTELQDAPPDDAGFLPDSADGGEFVGPPAPEPLAEPELAPAVDQRIMAAPVATVTTEPEAKLDERLVRLEQALEKLQQIEERLALRAPEPAPPPVTGGPTLLGGAASLLSGAALLVPASLGGRSAKAPPPGSFADIIAELRASYLMFVDPRYNLTWLGRIAPLVLLLMFLLPKWWVPLNWLLPDPFQWLYLSIGQLLASFFLFKVVVHEARRYRATAPDLPPSLRI